MKLAILGAGAFGTALAITYAQASRDTILWGRNGDDIDAHRENKKRLAGIPLPENLKVTSDLTAACDAQVLLLAVPAQQLAGFAAENAELLSGKDLVACCKGIDLQRLVGPSDILKPYGGSVSALTGPSFAVDIARGLPTALTLACSDKSRGQLIQDQLSTPTMRLYLTDDLTGAELAGALKNVIAIACGAAIGAGLGESARAALMTRGFAEMMRLAPSFGARPETLNGLCGLGDLALTCGSDLSRNFRFGYALGAGKATDASMTVEGAATARALTKIARNTGLDLPICATVAKLAAQEISTAEALAELMQRPLREEVTL